MSPAEMGWRLRGQVHAAWEARLAGQERYRPLSRPRGAALRQALGRGLAPLAPPAKWREILERQFPGTYTRLERQARGTLAGRIPIFSESIDVGVEIDWHRDPVSGVVSPRRPAALLDYRDRQLVGNARRIWEINRHHHLVELAQWAWVARDREAAAHVVTQLVDWCDQNPPLVGVNWTSSLELAIRTLAWAEILALLTDLDGSLPDDRSLELLVAAWTRQVGYVRAHDSRYSSANNHRIGEAAAVAVAGLLLPFHPQADDWWSWGSSVLETEVLLQVHGDGVGAEQAFAYQRFVLDFFILVRALARNAGRDLDPGAVERCARAAGFLDAVTRPDGSVFAVGDDDEGRALALGEDYDERALATLECAGWLFDEPTWRRGNFARARWLGLAPLDRQPTFGAAEGDGLETRTFGEGGYVVVQARAGQTPTRLLFDAGPLGYGALAAHGHADALSLCLWAGEDLLIDPGTGSYHGDPDWREALRGSDAHNTPQLDGRDQSQRRGLFLWGERARARLLASGAQDPWFVLAGSHDGYRGAGAPETRRLLAGHVERGSVFLLIVDEFLGRGRHRLRVPWHLGEGRCETRGAGRTPGFEARYPGGARVSGRAAVFGGIGSPSLTAQHGGEWEGGAWYAPRFEGRSPEGRLVAEAEAELPAAIVTVMVAQPADTPGEGAVSAEDIRITRCDGGLRCQVEAIGDGAMQALIAHPLADEVSDGRAALRGRFAAWKEGEPSPASGKAAVAGATAFRCGLMGWQATGAPITGVLSALAPSAESFSSPTNQTGHIQ